MSKLKPVAITSIEFGKVAWRTPPAFATGTPMYIIPDTHRVVSVVLLARIEGVLSISDYWTHHDMGEELRAIIDNKEPT